MDIRERLEIDLQRKLRAARRVVIKLGTSVVTGEDGEACALRLESLARSIASLREEARQVVLVSSGSIGLGRAKLGLSKVRLGDLVLRQACAAVGQSLLMQVYERLFSAKQLKIAQVLLTEDDFTDRRRYSNLRRAMERLLKLGVVPIVNENDTVSTAELECLDTGGQGIFGDNDRLAALIMSKLEADALILLTNVDGLLSNQSSSKSAAHSGNGKAVVRFVTEIDSDLQALAHGPSVNGRGGMVTKLEATEIAMRAGGIAVIANGTTPGILDQIFSGERVGTTFISSGRLGGKRRWIKYAAGVQGKLIVNSGARDAIIRCKASLLSSGVLRIEEKFKAMDVVSIADTAGREFARGIANYASREAEALISEAASGELQTKTKARVLVRRNNIVVVD